MTQPRLEVRGLKKSFGSLQVFADLDLDLYPGERVVLMGPSGCGKSTLLHMLAGLEPLDAGHCLWQAGDMNSWSDFRWQQFRAQELGLVFQQFHLLPHRNSIENLALAGQYAQRGPVSSEDAEQWLERMDLPKRDHQAARLLSGGEQQRLCIARALAQDPKLLLADEPTGNLDDANSQRLRNLFWEQLGEDCSLLIATHDAAWCEGADRVLHLEEGQLREERRKLRPQPPSPSSSELVQAKPLRHSVDADPWRSRPGRSLALSLTSFFSALLLVLGAMLYHQGDSTRRQLEQMWPPGLSSLRFQRDPTANELFRLRQQAGPGQLRAWRQDGEDLWQWGELASLPPERQGLPEDLQLQGSWVLFSEERARQDNLLPGDEWFRDGERWQVMVRPSLPLNASRVFPARNLEARLQLTLWQREQEVEDLRLWLLQSGLSDLPVELIDHRARRQEAGQALKRLELVLAGSGLIFFLLSGLLLERQQRDWVRVRRGELGLRRALGASRADLLNLFSAEQFQTSIPAACLGWLPSWWLLPPGSSLLVAFGLLLWLFAGSLLPLREALTLSPAACLKDAA